MMTNADDDKDFVKTHYLKQTAPLGATTFLKVNNQ